MKAEIMRINNSKGIQQIMEILGLKEMNIVSFALYCKVDETPTVEVKCYPVEKDLDNIVTETFELRLKE